MHSICCDREILHTIKFLKKSLCLSVCGVSSTSGRGDSRHGTSGSLASPRQSGANDLEGNHVPPHMGCSCQYEPLCGSVCTTVVYQTSWVKPLMSVKFPSSISLCQCLGFCTHPGMTESHCYQSCRSH